MVETFNTECLCRPIARSLFASPSFEVPETNDVTVEYGQVRPFQKHIKDFEVKVPEESNVTSYSIKKIESTMSYPFTFSRYEGRIRSGQKTVKLKVAYQPKVPLEVNVSIFHLIFDDSTTIKIVVRGETSGTRLTLSQQDLIFYRTPELQEIKKVIELKNTSDMVAKFKCDKNQSFFNIEPPFGTVEANTSVYLHISFNPPSFGEFYQQVFILIWYQEPLALNLLGLHKKTHLDVNRISYENYYLQANYRKGYSGFLRNVPELDNPKLNPVCLDKISIPFDNVQVGDVSRKLVLVKNYMQNDVTIVWIEDNDIFSVIPKKITIPEKKAVPCEITFAPKHPCKFYSRHLTVQIYWKQSRSPNTVVVPLVANLRVLGNSYRENEVLIPNVKFNRTFICFPPCIPQLATHTMFMIQNLGHLPLFYRFIPPKKSFIVLKPKIGMIKDDAIIVVQWDTKGKLVSGQEEIWYVEFNNNPDYKWKIIMYGLTREPNVVIGDDNDVNFGCLQIDIKAEILCPIRNLSCFHLVLELKTTSPRLTITNKTTLKPYDTTWINITCMTSVNSPRVFHGICTIRILHNLGQWLGEEYPIYFTMHMECAYGELCATPSELDLGNVLYNQPIETKFNLYNFGEAQVFFLLDSYNHDVESEEYEVCPSMGELPSKSKMEITVKGIAKAIGDNHIIVCSLNRSGKYSRQVIEDHGQKQLFNLKFYLEMFSIQIDDIADHNLGSWFSDQQIWEMFNLSKLNTILKNIKPGEHETFDFYMPEFQPKDDRYYFVEMVILNQSNVQHEVGLKRKKLCDCEMKEERVSINCTKKVYFCKHRESVSMTLSEKVFYPKSKRTLTIKLLYNTLSINTLAYVLDLGDERTVEFHIHLKAISPGTLSSYDKDYKMILKDIYIGLETGPIQTFWLYNTTEESVDYEANLDNINLLFENEGYPVMEFVNPKGEVGPSSTFPFQIRFTPIQDKLYKVEVPLDLGGTKETLKIEGRGVPKFNNETKECTSKITSNSLVSISTNHLVFEQICTWSYNEKIIFIKNLTKDITVEYLWLEAGIKYVVEVVANPNHGFLRPKECHVVRIKIKSYAEPILADIFLSVMVSNYNVSYLHALSLKNYDKALADVKGHFTITEDGVFEPEIERYVIEPRTDVILTIWVGINVIDQSDADKLWSTEDCMRIPPIKCKNKRLEEMFKDKLVKDISFIDETFHSRIENLTWTLRGMICDVIFSKRFETISDMIAKDKSLYYYHIKPAVKAEEKELTNEEDTSKSACTNLPNWDMCKILEEITFDSLTEAFKLGRPNIEDIPKRIEYELLRGANRRSVIVKEINNLLK